MDSFGVCLSARRADADIGPSTPASSLLQKNADNTTQPYKRALAPGVGCCEEWAENSAITLQKYDGPVLSSAALLSSKTTLLSSMAMLSSWPYRLITS
ncbi:MAG: hypothetical protein JWO48_995 [Bryobacterales bacterium]|nr:hypothetical protein [Bryobacterales bacterium]